MILFTHLKIILLQYFQFSVFSFSNNKFNPNELFLFNLTSEIESPTNDLKLHRNRNKNQSNEITKENAIDSLVPTVPSK